MASTGNRRALDKVLIALVVVAGASVLVKAPSEFRSAVEDASAVTRLSHTARELAPEVRAGVDGEALLAAARLIPRNETYYVNATPVDAETVRPMTFYVLFPRRYVDAPEDADWVLSFGAAPPTLDVRLGVPSRLGPGLVAAQVQR